MPNDEPKTTANPQHAPIWKIENCVFSADAANDNNRLKVYGGNCLQSKLLRKKIPFTRPTAEHNEKYTIVGHRQMPVVRDTPTVKKYKMITAISHARASVCTSRVDKFDLFVFGLYF